MNHRFGTGYGTGWKASSLAAACLLAGAAAGTLWTNRLGAELKGQLGALGQALLPSGDTPLWVQDTGIWSLLLQRGILLVVLWLAGMSLLALPGLCLSAAYVGFSVAFLVSCMTMQAGAGGLFLFLMSMLPQWLFFLPVALLLAAWAGMREMRLHGAGFLVLLVLMAAGTAAEQWVNPWFLRLAALILR